MQTTIILAHPWHGSFNKAILDVVIKELDKKEKAHQLIDLNKDGFNPVMQESELALYSQGQAKDELVLKYQTILKESDELIFIFPIWWNNIPAILKGFFDKVMLKDFAYIESPSGLLKGQLTHIKKTIILTTSDAPTVYINLIKGNPIKGIFINGTLKSVGIQNIRWLNSEMTSSGPREKREKYLKKVVETIK